MNVKSLNAIYIILKVSTTKEDPDLLDKIAGRVWTLDGVEDVTAAISDSIELPNQLLESMK